MCEGASKRFPDPKNSTAPGPGPGSEIPGSATVGSIDEKSPFVYTSVFLLDETLKN